MKIEYYSGPVSKLGLDSLVIPIFPDFAPMIKDEYNFRVLSEGQMMGEDLIQLALDNEKVICKNYQIIKKKLKSGDEMPFQIPPASAHVIYNKKKKLAGNLVYSCSVDIRNGERYFGYDLLKECLENVFNKTEKLGCKSVGILNLASPMFLEEFPRIQVLNKTENLSLEVLRKMQHPIKLEELYILGRDVSESTKIMIERKTRANPEYG